MTTWETYAHCAQGWPTHKEVLEVKKGQELVVTTDETAVASSTKLPISYPHFAHMCQAGDSLFVGRYLVNGADQSSLYLEVCSRQPSIPVVILFSYFYYRVGKTGGNRGILSTIGSQPCCCCNRQRKRSIPAMT